MLNKTLEKINTVIIFDCNKLSNKIGHRLLQLTLSPLLACTIHIIYNDSKTYTT